MIDSIYVALSGMLGAERGLNVISNNVANVNTPGFRGSTVSFANVFSGNPQDELQNDEFAGQSSIEGGGVDASQSELDMTPGAQQQTGNALDLFLQGTGFFVVQDASGDTRYTRDGSFHFDSAGDLVTSDESAKVMAENASGELVPISLQSLQLGAPKATTTVTMDGDLSSNDSEFTVSSVQVFDQLGGSHTLTLQFTHNTDASGNDGSGSGTGANPTPTAPTTPTSPTTPSTAGETTWTMTVTENGVQIGTGTVSFDASTGQIEAGSTLVPVTLALQGTTAADVSFDFSAVQGLSIGTAATTTSSGATGTTPSNSTLAVQKQDGQSPGTLTSETFDQNGTLQLVYSNGQTVSGPTLALAEVPDTGGLVEDANALFVYQGAKPVTLRKAGNDLQVISQTLEASNVDLTTQFSTLILMQRGYQGASQVVSTANDMLQDLMDMRSNR
jgi:flagellar hook protein FlgE